MISIKLSISIFETREIIPTWQDWVTINDKVYGAKPGPKQGTHKRWLLLRFMYCLVIFYSKTMLFFGPTINRKYYTNNDSFRLCSISPLLQFSNDILKYTFKPFKGKYVYFFCFGNKWVFAEALESIGQFSLQIILQRNFYYTALIFYLRVHSFDVLFSNILLWFFYHVHFTYCMKS